MICSRLQADTEAQESAAAPRETEGLRWKRSRERSLPALRQQQAPPELRRDHRHHDVEHDRQNQRVPWHRDRGEAEQQRHKWGEGHDHDRVIERDLRQCEMRLALHEVRPDRTPSPCRAPPQQDQPGDIAVDLIGRQEWPEQMGR